MKIKKIIKLKNKFPQCDLTTETANFYIKVGDKYILVHNSPALFCWSKYPGYPDNSIALKGFTSGPQNSISSIEDIDNKTGGKEVKELQSLLELPKSELMNNPIWAKYSKKYGDDIESAIRDAKANFDSRENMRDFLKYGLELAKYIPAGECWQGDCLFSKNSKKEEEINGTRYITFMPNKIVYAFSEDNADYNKVKNSDFGIAFHTIYRDKDGEMRQGFNVDPTRLNVPNNFYIMSPAINASKDKADYDLGALEKEYNNLKQLEQKLINDPAYEELINNATFMNYWNTFENANLADKKQVNLNVNTFINDLKDYVNDKLSKEYNKKLGAADTDKKRQNAENKFNSDTQKLMQIIDDNKSTLTNLVNCLNSAANIKMLMWAGLKKAKNDYSTFYKSRTKGYIPSEGEGIAMSDMDGNIVKIVDRSTFSSYNRDPDIMSGFEHESLQEAKHRKSVSEISKEDARRIIDAYQDETSEKVSTRFLGLKYYLIEDNEFTYDSPKYDEYMPTSYELHGLDIRGKRVINLYLYRKSTPVSFGIAEELYWKKFNMSLINNKLKNADLSNIDLGDLDEDFGTATQMADMGTFAKKPVKFSSKKKLKLKEDGNDKTAVIAAGRLNPPTIGHQKMIDALVSYAQGAKPKLFVTHTVDNKKNPLSYDSKVRWCQKAFGDKVEIPNTNAKTILQFLQELYQQGYTDIIYVGGGDRIGGAEDVTQTILKYNGQPDKQGNIIYDFNSIDFKNAGERSGDDLISNASASMARKDVLENDFDHFKQIVPFSEDDAKKLFKELKYAMTGKEESFLEVCNKRIKELEENMKVIHLNEAKRDVTSLNKNNYTPEMERKLDKALDTVDPSLDAPNPDWGANDYMNNVDDYTGLYVKQTGKPSDQQVVYNKKDIVKLHGKDGEEINNKLNSLRIEDEEGNKFKLNPTGSPSVITGKATLANPTFYQEAIYSLLLTGKVKQKDLITWLRESDVEANSGIFRYINTINYNKNTFKNEWSSFIDDWGKTFEIAQNNSSEFMSKISEKLNNAKSAVILHPGVKSEYDSIADRLLKGMDDIDKSDFYLCSGNVNKITSIMLELRKDPVAYTDFMLKNTDKILGISLKKVSSAMNIVWDIQGKKDNYFNEVMLKPTNKTSQVINLYGTDGHVYNYNIRTNNAKGNITMELKENGSTDAQMGKATNAFNIFASNTPLKSKDELQRMCNNSTLKMALTLLKYITGGKDIKPGEKYKLTKEGSKFISKILNVAAGFQGTNQEGKRITAPYIKVY